MKIARTITHHLEISGDGSRPGEHQTCPKTHFFTTPSDQFQPPGSRPCRSFPSPSLGRPVHHFHTYVEVIAISCVCVIYCYTIRCDTIRYSMYYTYVNVILFVFFFNITFYIILTCVTLYFYIILIILIIIC
jgi:hypothetical protein